MQNLFHIFSELKLLRIAFICIVLVMCLPIGVGGAAPISPADREEQYQRARQEAMEKKERETKKDVFLQEKKRGGEDFSLPEEDVSFAIRRIVLEGDDRDHFRKIQSYLSKFEGNKIGMKGIDKIVKGAGSRLIDDGYITTRVVLPEQDLSGGELRLRLIAGKIHAIRFEHPDARANWRTAFPARPGAILNLRHLEQGLEQLKRISSREVDFKIVPAEEAGQSDIVVSAKQGARLRFTAAIDNSGSKATGRLQTSEYLTAENLFNANDILRVGINHDGDRKGRFRGTSGRSFDYSIPNGDFTYAVSQNKFRYRQTVSTGFDDLEFSGTSEETRFRVQKLLTRDQSSKTNLEIGIALKESHSYVEDTEITIQRRKSTAFSLGLSHRKYIDAGVLDLSFAYRAGVPWFGAQPDPTAEASALPTLRYRLFTLDASYNRPVMLGKMETSYRFSLSGQFSGDKLYAVDCMSIGNRYTVRGFDGERTLMGERGVYLQNELSIPLTKKHQFFIGVDYGFVDGPSADDGAGRELIGSAAGLRGEIGKGIGYEVFAGWPLKKPSSFKTAAQTFGFQVVCQL